MDYLEKVQESLKYIEDNLISSISLDSLARQAYFSAYYYHKIFQSITGEPVMEYVRRKRLLHASRDLLYCSDNIADIAFKYQFNSHDVFIRAFKRQYGVTPKKYRKLNRSQRPFNTNNYTEEEQTMLDMNIAQKLQCTNNEKRQCLDLLESILELSAKTRNNGLLSLEGEIEKSDSIFMRKALQFIIDGIDPKHIRTILQNYIIVGDYKGKALLERILITEGILSIQAGENPVLIKEKLASLFGEDFASEVDKHFGGYVPFINRKIESFIRESMEIGPASPETSLFEDAIKSMSQRSIQRMLRDVSFPDIVNALKGSSGEVRISIIKNLPRKFAALLVDELNNTSVASPQIIDFQSRILKLIDKLRAEGEII